MSQIVSVSPHCHGKITTQSIMRDVLIALAPALVAGVINFGWRALLVTAVCAAACMFFEWGFEKLCGKPSTISDLSAAIVARIVLFLAFSSSMTAWVYPDAVSSATPLAMLAKGEHVDYLTLLLGHHGGCIGETCALALLLGFAYLLIRRVVTWQTPVCFVGTVFLLSLILGQDALAQVLSGGLLLGAIFMATDYSTSPCTAWGKVLFGIGAGLLTVLIRFYGAYAEGVSFAILFMNILTPYLTRWTRTKPLGGAKA